MDTNGRGGASSKRPAGGSAGSSGGKAYVTGGAADEPIVDDLIEDAIDMDGDDTMEDADFDEAAGHGAPDGEDVQLGEAGRNWERPLPPPLNPRTDALGTYYKRPFIPIDGSTATDLTATPAFAPCGIYSPAVLSNTSLPSMPHRQIHFALTLYMSI